MRRRMGVGRVLMGISRMGMGQGWEVAWVMDRKGREYGRSI